MPEFRELTPYEQEKWFDKYKRFLMDDEGEEYFLTHGDELGEAFDGALYCADKEDYGLSEWFVKAARVQVLDMYYDQIHLYTGSYGGADTPEELGLPPLENFQAKAEELGVKTLAYFGEVRPDNERQLWDWCMEWRDEHREDRMRRAELAKLEQFAGRLGKKVVDAYLG